MARKIKLIDKKLHFDDDIEEIIEGVVKQIEMAE